MTVTIWIINRSDYAEVNLEVPKSGEKKDC